MPGPVNGRQEIVVRPGEDSFIEDRAWGDDSRHVPTHEPLGQTGVLDLVAQGNLVPPTDEPAQVRLNRVLRHSRHGDPIALAVRPPGRQDELELTGQELGVLPIRFKEISDSKEDEMARVAGPDRLVLLHHRGERGGLDHEGTAERTAGT